MGRPDPVQEGYALFRVRRLASGKDEAYRSARGVSKHVDLGAQSSSGTPQSLVLGPPFPHIAC